MGLELEVGVRVGVGALDILSGDVSYAKGKDAFVGYG